TFWRGEIEAYAATADLRWRLDPSNELYGPARNRIRLRILPEIEREVAPAARRNLVALSTLAREAEAAFRPDVQAAVDRTVTWEKGRCVIDRQTLRTYPPAIRSRVVRSVLRRLGLVPGRLGTRSALQFIT